MLPNEASIVSFFSIDQTILNRMVFNYTRVGRILFTILFMNYELKYVRWKFIEKIGFTLIQGYACIVIITPCNVSIQVIDCSPPHQS